MPSALEAAGAAVQPVSAAPLHTNEFFTGLWTNGSPLGPGAVPFIYSKFYGASRYDRIVDGGNTEISPRLTLIRRPGHSVYNPGPFPPINRFFEFRGFTPTDEVIHLLADCDAPTNQLQNPNVDPPGTGWTYQSGWASGTGAPFSPAGGLAVYTGPGTAAVINNQHIPCTPGKQISASCMAIGETGASGNAQLEILFYDNTNTQIGLPIHSNPITANYIWAQQSVTATAPALTTYAVIRYAVYSSTSGGPRWGCTQFFGGYGPLTSATVREVTQPNTNTILWTKDPSAGRTSFVSDGNTLYAGDGVNTHQWVTSAKSWQPTTLYQPGDFIIDPNNNLQMAVGSVTANVVNIQVDAISGGLGGRKVTLWFSSATPFDVPANIRITTAGLTTVPAANETTPYTVQVESVLECSWTEAVTTIPVTGYSAETGTATTGNGVSGSAPPTWNTGQGLATQDGGLQWINMGSAVLPMGAAGPTTAPTISQAAAPTVYPPWAANTWYAPQGNFAIVDSNGNLQQVVAPGGKTGGGGAPTWATAVGAITADGTVNWQNQGPAAWQASHAYAVGNAVRQTYTYSVTSYQWTSDGHGGFIQKPVTTQVTNTSFFQCITAGTSGANQPAWNNGIGVLTIDNGVTWKNLGNTTGYPGGNQFISTAATILDPNGYLQKPTTQGESGATIPATWGTALGATTTDNTEVWFNAGAYATAATEAWQWAYSGKNSITGMISNASPVSVPLIPTVNNAPIIQGAGLANPPWDTIVLWRTAAGGSTLLYDDEFPNPGPGQLWVYTDTNLDPGNVASAGQGMLNELITAPINDTNDPPPSNFIPCAYYLTRIWGFTGNILRWTGGPDTVTGNGNTTMPPVNQFRLTAKGVFCWPTSVGLIVFTTSDIFAVLGQGTDTNPFYLVTFQQGIGMVNQDAFAVNGSTAYVMLSSHQVISIDPGAGEVEVGFPIADIFDNTAVFDPGTCYLAWHQGRSADTALYVANGSTLWFRMAAVSAPESGNVWSPAAVMAAPGKVRAIASAEITPGSKVLIAGPAIDGNPILMRDTTTNMDNGVPYQSNALIAAVVLAQPGTTAGVQFVVVEEKLITGATPIEVQLLFDEILYGSPDIHGSDFRTLRNITLDPPNLPKQKSIRTQRLWGLQDPSTIIKCRFYQQELIWPAENFPNELYTNTVYGRLPEKARK